MADVVVYNPGNTPLAAGRLVGGHPGRLEQNKDQRTGQPKLKADGTPSMTCFFSVAYAKNDPRAMQFIDHLRATDRAAYPNMHDPQTGQPFPAFSSKIEDGDSHIPNKKGKIPNQRDGYAGHWVVKYARNTGDLPPFKRHDGTQWIDADYSILNVGDYIVVGGTTTPNNSNDSPGMYRRVDMVGFVGHGERIVVGRTADESLGAPPPPPPGAMATPPAPHAAPPAPAAPVAPVAPPAPAAPPPYDAHMPAPPSGPQMTAAANGATYESFIAAGWTDDLLRQHGLML